MGKRKAVRFSGKSLLIGLLAGVALTLVGLDVAARMYREDVMLRLMPCYRAQANPPALEELPVPWVPALASAGKPQPYDDWTLSTLDGKSVRMGDFRGRAVFLTLSATWCGPCVAEMPGIEQLAKSLRNEPVSFLIVTNENEETIRKFLEKHPVRVPFYRRGESVPTPFDIYGVPRTYILDKNGVVVHSRLGAANWNHDSVRRYLVSLARGT